MVGSMPACSHTGLTAQPADSSVSHSRSRLAQWTRIAGKGSGAALSAAGLWH